MDYRAWECRYYPSTNHQKLLVWIPPIFAQLRSRCCFVEPQIVGRGGTDLDAQEGLNPQCSYTKGNIRSLLQQLPPAAIPTITPTPTTALLPSSFCCEKFGRPRNCVAVKPPTCGTWSGSSTASIFLPHSLPTNSLAGHHRRIAGERCLSVTLPTPLLFSL